MNDEEAFLAAIAAAPDDEAPHKIFADWLDEHDRPELAEWHRSWSINDAKAAREWMKDFASQHHEPYSYEGSIDSEKIVGETRRYLEERLRGDEWPDRYVQQGSESLRDNMYDDKLRAEFWRFFSLATGIYVPDAIVQDGNPFCCTC